MHGAATVADLLLARAGDDHPGLRTPDRTWSWAEVVAESRARAAALVAAMGGRPPGAPPHAGVLLDNGPEYLFWLGGAALAGAAVVGINPTRRGPHLARDVRASHCHLVVTDAAGAALLGDAGWPGPGEVGAVPPGGGAPACGPSGGPQLWQVDTADHAAKLAALSPIPNPIPTLTPAPGPGAPARPPAPGPVAPVTPDTLLLLLFTSGTTGDPKAVRCTQGRLAAIATRCVDLYDFRRDDVCFCPMPLFHGNAVMSLWAPAVAAGATVAVAGRFSASRFADQVRELGATRFTYVGKALSYVLETPPRADDADTPLRVGFGTEASAAERARFEARFGCRLVEGYGSSEGGIAINVVPGTPPGSLGRPAAGDVAVVDPASGAECPPARFDDAGRMRNPGEAIGEIVNRDGAPGFEGYYGDEAAAEARTRDGWYWSGDLGYRDEAGFFYFAGRSGDWLRVDSENFAAGPVQRILAEDPHLSGCAVYPVPDVAGGDQVMAAVVPGHRPFDPEAFAAFLAGRQDLGTKWAPRFVRVVDRLPLTATGKPTTVGLRSEGWWASTDPLYWRPGRDLAYRPLDAADRRRLLDAMAEHGRAHLVVAGG